MISPDDPILSAYLDGELDAPQAGRLEQAIAADPALSEAVEALRAVRRSVAGLSRPQAPDLSARVLDRLVAVARPRGSWGRSRRARLAGGAAAAAILLACSSALLPHLVRALRPDRVDDPAVLAANVGGRPPLEAGAPEVASESEDREAHEITSSTEPPPVVDPVDVPAVAVADTPVESPDQQRVRALLDDQRLQKIFVITDQIDRPYEPKVLSLVESTTQRDFFRISVAQGIVIDPAHPGKATVFAVVLDESELQPFRDRLKATFADRVQEEAVKPLVALQLADIGQVVSLPAHPAGDFKLARPTELALRATPMTPPSGTPPAPAVEATGGRERERSRPDLREPEPSPSQPPQADLLAGHPERKPAEALGAPARDSGQTVEGSRPAPRDDGTQCVVLVWVAEPSTG